MSDKVDQLLQGLDENQIRALAAAQVMLAAKYETDTGSIKVRDIQDMSPTKAATTIFAGTLPLILIVAVPVVIMMGIMVSI